MKRLRISFLITFYCLISCSMSSENIECNNCNDEIINDYLFKKVTLDDLITNLLEVNPSISIDQCIKYKIIDNDYENAIIVDDCCCNF